MTLEEFMKHAADAAYMGDAGLLRAHAREVFDELDRTRAALDRVTRERDFARETKFAPRSANRTHAAESARALAKREEKGT
jgi:hypothetical protein